jgi:uncharacterized protein (DUF4415 family)
MKKMVKKSIEQVQRETDLERVEKEIQDAPVPSDEEGLSSEFLQSCKSSRNRFAKLVPREPRSKKVTIRFEREVLSFLQKDAERLGKPYQTHINDILRTYYYATAEESS